jgi:hypothetical protein
MPELSEATVIFLPKHIKVTVQEGEGEAMKQTSIDSGVTALKPSHQCALTDPSKDHWLHSWYFRG